MPDAQGWVTQVPPDMRIVVEGSTVQCPAEWTGLHTDYALSDRVDVLVRNPVMPLVRGKVAAE